MRLIAAASPAADPYAAQLLVVDPRTQAVTSDRVHNLGAYLGPGDLLVVNDAATVPASLSARSVSGREHELRLTEVAAEPWVTVFGPGDWRTQTEARQSAELFVPGDELTLADGTRVPVLEVSTPSSRLVRVKLADDRDALLERLYRLARPVQYAYLDRSLRLAEVQTSLATRPVAVEAPSAGFALSWSQLISLRRAGVELAVLTHAAGLSATSDPILDALLPLCESYEIPEATVQAVDRARRVVAAGTTVMRALEGNVATHGRLVAGHGRTDLVIKAGFAPVVVGGMLSGVHDDASSHYRIVSALLGPQLVKRALRHAVAGNYRNHEFGDSMLILSSNEQTLS